MAQYFPWCGCCTQCTRRYDFDAYPYLQWDLVDDPAGSTPVAITWDDANGRLDVEGEGSVTVRTTANPKTIHVAAEIQSLTSGSAGVTVRRVDSAESISLWWMGGTSYELRHGTTVLESIVGSGSGEVKVELATPREATTDVLVYIGGTLAHTETAVAFVMPDVLHLGMIIDGEAAFEWVEVSPCPMHNCKPYVVGCPPSDQVEIAPLMPRFWRLNVPAFEDGGSNPCEDNQDPTKFCYQGLYSGDHLLLSGDNVVHVNTSDDPGDWKDAGAQEGCVWLKVEPSRGFDPWSGLTPPSGKYGTSAGAACDLNSSPVEPVEWHYDRVAGWNVRTEWRNTATFPDPPVYEHRFVLTCVIRYTHEPNGGVNITEWVDYYSAWISTPSVEIHDQDITLTRDGDGSTSQCLYVSFPASLTLKPVGSTAIDYDTFRPIIGCWEECEPPVTPQPETCYVQTINLVDADDNPWYMTAVLGVQFDEVTGSWYWQGTASPHPLAKPHPACGDIIFGTVKIHCVELEEGASKTWVLDFTYDGQTERFPMSEDPQFGFVWEGTTDIMCSGQIWDFFAGPLNPSSSTWQFGSCEWDACADPHGYYFGAWLNTECYGEAGIDFPEYRSGPLIFSPTSARPWMSAPVGTVYYSPVPSVYAGLGEITGVFLYVESGTVRVQFADGGLDPVADMFASVGYSCEPTIGRPEIDDTSPISYMWGSPDPTTEDPFGICAGTSGNGSWEITFP